MSQATEFLTIFNQLEKQLINLFGSTHHVGFKRLVDLLSARDGLVDQYKQDLIELVELRNAIVHRSTGQPIAEPHPQTVAKARRILDLLTHPPTALSIASHPVFTCRTTTLLTEVLQTMKNKFYSFIPVYQDRTIVGVLSEHSLVKWLANQGQHQNWQLGQVAVGQLQDFFDRADDKHQLFSYVAQDDNAYQVRTAFLSADQRLGAVFVTATGSATEPILGIITAWDLPRLTRDDR